MFQVLLVAQAVCLFLERRPVQLFRLGAYAALSCAVVIVLLIGANTSLRDYGYADSPTIGLMSTQGGLLLIMFVGCISVNRRPTVYTDEKPVDGQSAVSLFGRYSFSWAESTLEYAGKNKKLELSDLPVLPGLTRAANLERDFHSGKQRSKLWRQIFWKFRWGLVKQATMTTAVGVVQFGPQFAMYHVLQLLQRREKGAGVATEAYLWVAGLGASMVVSTMIEAWLYWIIWSELGIPIRNLLSTLIFTKTTRRKNVQDAPKVKAKKPVTLDGSDTQAPALEGNDAEAAAAIVAVNEPTLTAADPAAASKDKDKDKEGKEGKEEEDTQKTRQSTINLVAVSIKTQLSNSR